MRARYTLIQSTNPAADHLPTVCFIPGGPGLSSATLRSMDLLRRSFHLAYVDPPGTGKSEALSTPTLENIVSAIEGGALALERPVILCGHSFGAVYVAELVLRGKLPLSGITFIAPALCSETLLNASAQYQESMTPALSSAEKLWKKNPNDGSFRHWLSAYGTLFFTEKNRLVGEALVRSDLVSSATFLQVRNAWKPDEKHAMGIRDLSCPKLLIAGDEDQLFKKELLEKDAKTFGCKFFQVEGAAHFVTLDKPDQVARLIEENFRDQEGKNK